MSRVCYERVSLPYVLSGIFMDALEGHPGVQSIMHIDARWGDDQYLSHEVLMIGEICLERYLCDVTTEKGTEVDTEFVIVDYAEMSCFLQSELNKWKVIQDNVQTEIDRNNAEWEWQNEEWLDTADDIIESYQTAVDILDSF